MKSIYKKIKLSPFFLLIIFISLISGLFKDVITLFMIIIIHELGHIILSYLFKWNIKSVEIGVFGGFITYDDVIDKPFIEDKHNPAHDGLKGITKYIYKNHIPLHIHGHLHEENEQILKNGTKSICVYMAKLIEI